MGLPAGVSVKQEGGNVVLTCYSNFSGRVIVERCNEPLRIANDYDGLQTPAIIENETFPSDDEDVSNHESLGAANSSPLLPPENQMDAPSQAALSGSPLLGPRLLSAEMQTQMQPSHLQPSQLQPSQVQPSQVQPSQVQPSQMQPSQVHPSQNQPSQLRPATFSSPDHYPLGSLAAPSGAPHSFAERALVAAPPDPYSLSAAPSGVTTGQISSIGHHLEHDSFVKSQDSDMDDDDADYIWPTAYRASQAENPPPSASPPASEPSQSPGKHPRDEVDEEARIGTVTEQGTTGKRVRFSDQPGAAHSSVPEQLDARSPWAVVLGGTTQPGKRWGATFTRVSDNEAVLIGGERENATDMCGELLDDVYTLARGDWTKGLTTSTAPATTVVLPRPRAWHSATRVGEKVFVYGGEVAKDGDDRLQLSEVLVLDLKYGLFVETKPTGATSPSPRAGHVSCLLKDGVRIFIGFGIFGGRWCRDYWLLCTDTLSWTKLKPKSSSCRPPPRSYATATLVGGEVMLFGGNDNNRSYNDILIGRVEDRKGGASIVWREPLLLGSSAPAPRTGHCATVSADGNLIIYGGWDDLGAQRLFFSDVWELVQVSEVEYRWRKIHTGPAGNTTLQPGARAGAAICEASKEAPAVVTGGFRGFSQLSDSFSLDLAKCRPGGVSH